MSTAGRLTWSDPAKALASFMAQMDGLDRSFFREGLCRQYPAGQRAGWTSTFHEDQSNNRKAKRAAETELAKAALMICANCPVQYDCAAFGVRSQAVAGIYGVRDSNLQWLRRYGTGTLLNKLLEEGRKSGEAVEVFVSRKRRLVDA